MRIPEQAAYEATVMSTDGDAVFVLNALVELASGGTTLQTITLQGLTADTPTVFRQAATTGKLVGLTVETVSNFGLWDQAFIQVRLLLGSSDQAPGYVTLVAGWLNLRGVLSWPTTPALPSWVHVPGPRPRTWADPSAGDDVFATLLNFGYRDLIAVSFTLQTDGTAANRLPSLFLQWQLINIWEVYSTMPIAANSTERVVFLQAADRSDLSSAERVNPLPIGGVPRSTTIGTAVANLQAGDQISDLITYGTEFWDDF